MMRWCISSSFPFLLIPCRLFNFSQVSWTRKQFLRHWAFELPRVMWSAEKSLGSAAAYAKSGITFQLDFSLSLALSSGADILCMQIADHQIISFQQFGENPNNILRHNTISLPQKSYFTSRHSVWKYFFNKSHFSKSKWKSNVYEYDTFPKFFISFKR